MKPAIFNHKNESFKTVGKNHADNPWEIGIEVYYITRETGPNFDEIIVSATEREVDNHISDCAQSLAGKVFRRSLEDKLDWCGKRV